MENTEENQNKEFKPRKKLYYANVGNDIIQATMGEHFKFATEDLAKKKIKSFEDVFIRSRHQPQDVKKGVLVLWVKGYEITEDENEKGHLGNFAAISYKKTDDKKFTLYATKIEVDLQIHPQKRRPKAHHPNWGHPVLRRVKKKWFYEEIEEAQADLEFLHEEYPNCTIPLGNKMNVIIYSKAYEGDKPIKKFDLIIKPDERGFFIEAVEKVKPMDMVNKEEKAEQKKTKGFFTAMVQAKKKRPAPKTDPLEES